MTTKQKATYVTVRLTNKQGMSPRTFRMYVNPAIEKPITGEMIVLTGKTDMVSTPMDNGGEFHSYNFSARREGEEFEGKLTKVQAKKAWAYMLTLPDQHFDEVSGNYVVVNEPYKNDQEQVITLQDVVVTVVPNRKTPESVLARLN